MEGDQVLVPTNVLRTKTFWTFKDSGSILYIYLCSAQQYGRKNVGSFRIKDREIIFAQKEIRKFCKNSNSTFRRAIRGLIDRGFVRVVQQGSFHPKKPTVYALSKKWMYAKDRKDFPYVEA